MVMELVDMTPEERAVWHEIETRPGRDHAIALQELAVLVGASTRVVQMIIKHLIERHACAIGSATGGPSGAHGYYRIASIEDLEQAEKQLEHRIIKTAQRLAALKKNTPSECLGQIQLALNES